MIKILGIDLGTTRSIVAVMKGDLPIVVPTAEGEPSCPSIVAFDQKGTQLIGRPAKQQAAANPENTVYSVKRLMGRDFDDPETRRMGAMVPYEIVAGPRRDARIHLPGPKATYTPQEISAKILQKLQSAAKAYLAEPINLAIIAVPACFNDCQRQATVEASRLAGLEVLCLIDAPIAAALAHCLDRKGEKTTLVFDLGGGTCDVSILEISDGAIKVKATTGDPHLGGDDWDDRIIRWLVSEFKAETGLDLAWEVRAFQRVREAAETAKINLSRSLETEIYLPFITADLGGPRHLQRKLTRFKFEQLTVDLVGRCRWLLEQTLREAELSAAELDRVILLGGSVQMPMIQELVGALTDQIAGECIGPSEGVALGAAILGNLCGKSMEGQDLSDLLDDFLDPLGRQHPDDAAGKPESQQSHSRRSRDFERTVPITLTEAFHGTTRVMQRGDGQEIEIIIPPGVRSGTRIRLKGQGEPGVDGEVAGDLYLRIEVASDQKFQRQDDDLRITVPVDLYSALLGGQVEVSSLDRTVNLTLPPGTIPGTVFRLRGLGMPRLHHPDQRGDLYATVQLQLPQDISPEEKKLIEQWRELRQNSNQDGSRTGARIKTRPEK